MSRIGKNPVAIPSGVDVTTAEGSFTVKGPKGELSRELTGGIAASVGDGKLTLTRQDDTKASKALHGLFRSIAAGMVEGVTKGFEKRLEVVGVSYQASIDGGKRLKLDRFSLSESEIYLASADVQIGRKNRDEALRRLSALLADRIYDEIDLLTSGGPG